MSKTLKKKQTSDSTKELNFLSGIKLEENFNYTLIKVLCRDIFNNLPCVHNELMNLPNKKYYDYFIKCIHHYDAMITPEKQERNVRLIKITIKRVGYYSLNKLLLTKRDFINYLNNKEDLNLYNLIPDKEKKMYEKLFKDKGYKPKTKYIRNKKTFEIEDLNLGGYDKLDKKTHTLLLNFAQLEKYTEKNDNESFSSRGYSIIYVDIIKAIIEKDITKIKVLEEELWDKIVITNGNNIVKVMLDILISLIFTHSSDKENIFKSKLKEFIKSKGLNENILKQYEISKYVRTNLNNDFIESEEFKSLNLANDETTNDLSEKHKSIDSISTLKNSIFKNDKGDEFIDLSSLTAFTAQYWHKLFEDEKYNQMLPFLEKIAKLFPKFLELCTSPILWVYCIQNKINKKYEASDKYFNKLKATYEFYPTENNKHWYDSADEFRKLEKLEEENIKKHPEVKEYDNEEISLSQEEKLDMDIAITTLTERNERSTPEELITDFDAKKFDSYIKKKKKEALAFFDKEKNQIKVFKVGDNIYYASASDSKDKIFLSQKSQEKFIKIEPMPAPYGKKFFYYIDYEFLKKNYENIETFITKVKSAIEVHGLARSSKDDHGFKFDPKTLFIEIKIHGDNRLIPFEIYFNSDGLYCYKFDKIVNHKELLKKCNKSKIVKCEDYRLQNKYNFQYDYDAYLVGELDNNYEDFY